MTRLLCLLLPLVLLAGCHREPAAPPPPAVADADIPPVQPRPDNLGPSVKWPAESARFQQIRRQAWHEGIKPDSISQAREASGRRGIFRVQVLDMPVHRVLHDETWRIRVSTPDGQPAAVSTVHISGGMPEHGHGLPTEPAVRGGGKPGEFIISGLQFGMPGWWEVSLYLADARRDDSVTFNVIAD